MHSNQVRRPCGPDMGPNCLQKLTADDKNQRYQGYSKTCVQLYMVRALFISIFFSPGLTTGVEVGN